MQNSLDSGIPKIDAFQYTPNHISPVNLVLGSSTISGDRALPVRSELKWVVIRG